VCFEVVEVLLGYGIVCNYFVGEGKIIMFFLLFIIWGVKCLFIMLLVVII
jgi:hypothetical protein